MDDIKGSTEILGTQEITEILGTTKGNMGILDGVLLPNQFMFQPGTRNWKPGWETLKGKQVRAKGELWKYHCLPHEQCMEGCCIRSLHKIEYLVLAE